MRQNVNERASPSTQSTHIQSCGKTRSNKSPSANEIEKIKDRRQIWKINDALGNIEGNTNTPENGRES